MPNSLADLRGVRGERSELLRDLADGQWHPRRQCGRRERREGDSSATARPTRCDLFGVSWHSEIDPKIHAQQCYHPPATHAMITTDSPEWVLLSAIYHHVLKQSPSTERAKREIASARKSGQLRLRAEQTREHIARPELRLKPGEQPPRVEPTTAFDQPVPNGNYLTWDLERSYATRRESTTKSIFEYVNIVGHRDDVLALWPPNTKDPVAHVVEPPAVDPFRTGAPGRPTSADAIYTEAERRISSGEVVPQPRGLARFAQDLSVWWEAERQKFFPPGPAMKAGTIGNKVRDLWRKSQAKT
jgi:hypothetical protein